MTTLYVSQTATNNYRIGIDSGSGDTKATAWLTVEYALANAGTNDTITINDGTYTHASTWFAPVDDSLTINAENRHLTILRAAASQARTFHIGHASVNEIEFGEVVLDGYDDTASIVTQGTQGSSITFNGTKLLNPTSQFTSMSRDINIAFQNNFICEANSLSQHAINLGSVSGSGGAAGALTLTDGEITVSEFTAAKSVIRNFPSDVTGKTFSMDNVTIVASGDSSGLDGVSIRGCSSVSIKNSALIISDSAASSGDVSGIVVKNSSLDTCDSLNIYDNTVDITRHATSGGQAITVGDNDDTTPSQGANTITNPYVFGNTISGSNHGFLIGWVESARIYANKLSDNVLGIVLKGSTSCYGSGNVIIDCTGSGALRFKGDTDSIFGNNLVIYNSGASVSSAIPIYADASGATNSTGCGAYNNIVYADETISDWTLIAASSICTFNSNNYFADTGGGVSANPYNYQGTGYADLAAWNAAAHATSETETDPDFIDLAGMDYTVQNASLSAGGYLWWGLKARPEGFNGEPLADRNISVGAIQGKDSVNHPFHPANL